MEKTLEQIEDLLKEYREVESQLNANDKSYHNYLKALGFNEEAFQTLLENKYPDTLMAAKKEFESKMKDFQLDRLGIIKPEQSSVVKSKRYKGKV